VQRHFYVLEGHFLLLGLVGQSFLQVTQLDILLLRGPIHFYRFTTTMVDTSD
jgi:hypothetical protein